MQAVILAAGKGTRMRELTKFTPKPLLSVSGKSLLEHKFETLPDEIKEIVLIVGYEAQKIKDTFQHRWKDRHITYIHQDTLDGTAGALWRARETLCNRFLVMMGDDLYSKEDQCTALACDTWGVGVMRVKDMRAGGSMVIEEDEVRDIQEGAHTGTEGNMCTGLYVLDMRIFENALIPKSAGSSEYGLPQTILSASKEKHIPLRALFATRWFQVSSPEDLMSAETWLSQRD